MHGIPNPRPLNARIASDLKASQAVSVVNAQTSDEEIVIGRAGMGKMKGNLREWTDTAVTVLRTELKKRSVTVADDGPKSLKVAITAATLSSRPMGAASTVQIEVETGDGGKHVLSGRASSMQPPRACDGAVADAVKAILTDEAIQAYLLK